MCVIKRKLKHKIYNNCLEATQLENKKNYLKTFYINSFFCYKGKQRIQKQQETNIKKTAKI